MASCRRWAQLSRSSMQWQPAAQQHQARTATTCRLDCRQRDQQASSMVLSVVCGNLPGRSLCYEQESCQALVS